MPESISIREFARRLEVSHTAVRKAITSRRIISVDDDGRLIWPYAADEFKFNRVREDDFAPDENDSSGEGSTPDLRHWKAEKEKWMAQRHELAARKQAGELVEVAEVNKLGFEIGRDFRNFLYNIPSRASPLLVAKSQREAYDILMEFVHEGLIELQSKIMPEAMREPDNTPNMEANSEDSAE